MALTVSDGAPDARDGSTTPDSALRFAWVAWLSLLLFPAVIFLYVLWSVMGDGAAARANTPTRQYWFMGAMAYMVVVVPLAIFWRSHLFKPYWRGEVVEPRAYLWGMMAIWIALEVGGLLGLAGCYLTHSLLPNLVPSIVAFVLFLPLWPSGRSMTRHVGNHDDPSTYEEPR